MLATRSDQGLPATVDRPVELNKPAVTLNKEDQFVQDLVRDGFAIVRNVIPQDRAIEYRNKAEDWLEGFKMGYKRDDPSTWRAANVPACDKGGLYSRFSFSHSQFVWDVKSEPEYVKLFERIWSTDKLTVSFDGGFCGIPLPKEELPNENKPWPHADQSPYRPGLYCIQSLMNLAPNEEKDGGLWVMKGSTPLFPQMVKELELEKECRGRDHFPYSEKQEQWLKDHGCEWIHPNLGPGDCVFWDSRCAHYGAAPEGGRHRFAIYTCYKADAHLSDAQREIKVDAFEKGYVTSHDPCTFILKANSKSPDNILFPYGRPKLSEKALKAVGVIRY